MNELSKKIFDFTKKYWHLILAALFALAAAFGLLQHGHDPYAAAPEKTYFASADKTLADYYQQSRELAKSENNATSTASFLAVGDIMLSRGVAAQIQKNNDPTLPFKNAAELLNSTDFVFGNLESPLASTSPVIGGHAMVFGAPQENIKSLADYNFKILNLANNHALDQKLAGLLDTKNYLNGLGIQTIGAGKNLDEAWQTVKILKNGITLCFLGAAYSSVNDGGQAKNEYVARMEDLDALKKSLAQAQTACDFIVVSMHAGTEYTLAPNRQQETFARAAIDAGADMVIGSHPHWVQTIERYCPNSATALPSPRAGEGAQKADEGAAACTNPKYIFYSLGNFIFDQNWSENTREGLALKIQLAKSAGQNSLQGTQARAQMVETELIPVVIENSASPRPATDEESQKILKKIGQAEKILKP